MFVETLGAPAENAAVVTPSDTVNLLVLTRGVVVGVAGNISVEMMGTGTSGGSSHSVVIPVSAGIVYPIRVSRVNSTSTTATGIVALW